MEISQIKLFRYKRVRYLFFERRDGEENYLIMQMTREREREYNLPERFSSCQTRANPFKSHRAVYMLSLSRELSLLLFYRSGL